MDREKATLMIVFFVGLLGGVVPAIITTVNKMTVPLFSIVLVVVYAIVILYVMTKGMIYDS